MATRKKQRASTPPPSSSSSPPDDEEEDTNRLGRVQALCYGELDYHRVRFQASADTIIGERNRHMRLRSMDEARCVADWFKATMFFGVRPEDNGQFSAFTYVRSDGLFTLKPIHGLHDSALQAARAHDAHEPRPQRRNFRAQALAAAEAAAEASEAAKRKAAQSNGPTARQVAFARTHLRRLELLAMAQIRAGKRDAALRTLQAWVDLCLVKPVARDKHALLSCAFASLQSALAVGAQAYAADLARFIDAMLAVARTVSSNFEPAQRGDHGRCAFYSAALHALAVDAGDVAAALQHAAELASKQPFSSMAAMHVTRASLHLVAHRTPLRSPADAEADLNKAGTAAALALQLDARNPAALALVAQVCALSHRLLGTAAVPELAAACAQALDADDNAAVALAADVLVADATVPESTQMRALLRLAVDGRCDAVVEACRRTDAARLAEAVFPLGQAAVHCLSALPNTVCASDFENSSASVVAVWRIVALCMERLSASAALLDKLVDVARNELGRFFVGPRPATEISNEAAFRALVAFRVAPAYYERCCVGLQAKMSDVLTKALANGGMEWHMG